MKFFFGLMFIFATFQSQANAVHPFISVKDRLRLSLWVEGLSDQPVEKNYHKKVILPEQLERALRKI